jgi:hypothetical protein
MHAGAAADMEKLFGAYGGVIWCFPTCQYVSIITVFFVSIFLPIVSGRSFCLSIYLSILIYLCVLPVLSFCLFVVRSVYFSIFMFIVASFHLFYGSMRFSIYLILTQQVSGFYCFFPWLGSSAPPFYTQKGPPFYTQKGRANPREKMQGNPLNKFVFSFYRFIPCYFLSSWNLYLCVCVFYRSIVLFIFTTYHDLYLLTSCPSTYLSIDLSSYLYFLWYACPICMFCLSIDNLVFWLFGVCLPTLFFLSVSISVYLSFFLPMRLSMWLSIHLSMYLSICRSFSSLCLSIFLSFFQSFLPIALSIYLSFCLSICFFPSGVLSIDLYTDHFSKSTLLGLFPRNWKLGFKKLD